jgi:hypothetical protein
VDRGWGASRRVARPCLGTGAVGSRGRRFAALTDFGSKRCAHTGRQQNRARSNPSSSRNARDQRGFAPNEARILANFQHFCRVEFASGKCPHLAIRDRSIRKGEQGSNISVALARSRDATKNLSRTADRRCREHVKLSLVSRRYRTRRTLGDDVKLDRVLIVGAIAPGRPGTFSPYPAEVEDNGHRRRADQPVDRGPYRHAPASGGFMNRKVRDQARAPGSIELL